MIATVLLAAGSARRFDGTQKLLATVRSGDAEVALVRHSIAGLLGAGLREIVVVIGRDAEAVRQSLDGVEVRFALNPDYAAGMSTSLRKGVVEAFRLWPNADGVLVALGDQPLTGTGIIEALLSNALDDDAHVRHAIVAPRFRGEVGNPVLFARGLVPELLEVSGDRGGRAVLERDESRVCYVDFDRAMPADVDTVSDLAVLTNISRS
ncbi:MAG TPA: nucleotidyltransferase family protein [Gemmatimonadaceae bacterium]|jgi:molybdenum cofactor cytidylyltransferase